VSPEPLNFGLQITYLVIVIFLLFLLFLLVVIVTASGEVSVKIQMGRWPSIHPDRPHLQELGDE